MVSCLVGFLVTQTAELEVVVMTLCIAIKLIFVVLALRRSTASYAGNVMLGLLMAFGGLFVTIVTTRSRGLGLELIMVILYTITGIAMLIPMDSSIFSFLRPFRLEKSVLPQYQLHPQMPIMSPVPAYHQPAPVVYQHPAPTYQQPSPVYQQQFVGQ